MLPSFLTPAYIEACRQASFVQGWWTATWEVGPDVKHLFAPDDEHWRTKQTPPWALPPIGTGLQTNVRVGDFYAWGGVPPGRQVVEVVPHVRLDQGDVLWRVAEPTPQWESCDDSTTHCLSEAEQYVFLPRFDQLLYLGSIGGRSRHSTAIMVGADLDLPVVLDKWLWETNENLKDLGCPERRLT